LHHSNSISTTEKPVVLAAKWVFLEWFARVWQAHAAVETLWKLFFAKMRRGKLGNQKINGFRQPDS
jgi:hypothetical protein